MTNTMIQSGKSSALPGGFMAGLRGTAVAKAAAVQRQFVTFTIGDEEYGVDIMVVREIKGWVHATRLPSAPKHMRGVINLRGTMVPVFDLRARFGEGQTEVTKTHVVIIVSVTDRVIGLLVDAVSDILTIEMSDIQPVPVIDRTVDVAFLSGLVTVEQRMVALLDLPRLFDLERLPSEAALAAAVGQAGDDVQG